MRDRRRNLSSFDSGGSYFPIFPRSIGPLLKRARTRFTFAVNADVAVNKKIADGSPVCPQCGNQDLKENKSIEVSNIFSLKTKFSEPFDLKIHRRKQAGKSYGNGLLQHWSLGRLLGTIANKQCREGNYLAGSGGALPSSSYWPKRKNGQIIAAGRKSLR